MNNLGNFLERFKNFILSAKAEQEVVIKAIEKVTTIKIAEKDIRVKDFVITLNVRPLIRNEIYMRKSAILQELRSMLGDKAPREIR